MDGRRVAVASMLYESIPTMAAPADATFGGTPVKYGCPSK